LTYTLTIERLAFGGGGVSHLPDGKVVFLRGGLPGDVVEAELTEEKKRFAHGRVLRLISGGDGRRESGCPSVGAVADGCGGCLFQACEYTQEWDWKSAAALDSFWRTAKSVSQGRDGSEVPVIEHRAPAHSGYRRRLRLSLNEEGHLGFLGHGSHKIEGDIAQCAVAHPTLQEAARGLELKGPGTVLLELDANGESAVALAEVPRQDKPALSAPLTGLRMVHSRTVSSVGTPWFHVDVDGMRRRLPVGVFTQANAAMNEVLVERTVAAMALVPGHNVLEFYCGAGNFTLSVARAGGTVRALDAGQEGLDAGRVAATENGVSESISFSRANLQHGVPSKVRKTAFDTILLDPPRTGAAAVIQYIGASHRGRVVYVSCDAGTAGRDVGRLLSAGFEVGQIDLVDMFPRTHHVEIIVTLQRPAK
jgi:23S rRNA (uracil1939-C5)-methyltransferase